MKLSLIHVPLLLMVLGKLPAADRPNVVYIIADDHAYRDFGFMGSHDALTPNIDELAARSARFVNGYVPSSLCSPSLAVLRDIAYRWIRDGDYKLIVPHTRDAKAPWGNYASGESLFNLVRDPEEKHNLAGTHPERTRALRQTLDAWWTPGGDSAVR